MRLRNTFLEGEKMDDIQFSFEISRIITDAADIIKEKCEKKQLDHISYLDKFMCCLESNGKQYIKDNKYGIANIINNAIKLLIELSNENNRKINLTFDYAAIVLRYYIEAERLNTE